MSPLTFKQLESVDSLWKEYVTWQDHTVKQVNDNFKVNSLAYMSCIM